LVFFSGLTGKYWAGDLRQILKQDSDPPAWDALAQW